MQETDGRGDLRHLYADVVTPHLAGDVHTQRHVSRPTIQVSRLPRFLTRQTSSPAPPPHGVSVVTMDTSTERKLVVVIGATGNQGGSVARRFLREGPKHLRVRGLTRNPASQPSRELAALGAEVVRADLFDADSLKTALKGANVIFSVTNYWEPFDPGNLGSSRREAERLGLGSVRRYAGHLEETAGRNIADAAAETAETLDGNGFIVSTLSHARDCSGGRITELYHFDAKADIFPRYVEERYPDLARKMSGVQTGCFMTSYRILPNSWLIKASLPLFIAQMTRLTKRHPARERHVRDALLHRSGKAGPSSGPCCGRGQFRLRRLPDVLRERLYGSGHDVYLARVGRRVEQGHRYPRQVSTDLAPGDDQGLRR